VAWFPEDCILMSKDPVLSFPEQSSAVMPIQPSAANPKEGRTVG
jgi:hypothetical protein